MDVLFSFSPSIEIVFHVLDQRLLQRLMKEPKNHQGRRVRRSHLSASPPFLHHRIRRGSSRGLATMVVALAAGFGRSLGNATSFVVNHVGSCDISTKCWERGVYHERTKIVNTMWSEMEVCCTVVRDERLVRNRKGRRRGTFSVQHSAHIHFDALVKHNKTDLQAIMSEQQATAGASMHDEQVIDKQSDHMDTPTTDQQALDGTATRQHTHDNHNKGLLDDPVKTYTLMVEHFSKGNIEEGDKSAQQLALWGPYPEKVHARLFLGQVGQNALLHAHLAANGAAEAIAKSGETDDEKLKLLELADRTLARIKAEEGLGVIEEVDEEEDQVEDESTTSVISPYTDTAIEQENTVSSQAKTVSSRFRMTSPPVCVYGESLCAYTIHCAQSAIDAQVGSFHNFCSITNSENSPRKENQQQTPELCASANARRGMHSALNLRTARREGVHQMSHQTESGNALTSTYSNSSKRLLDRQLPDGGTTVFQRNVPENQLMDQIRDIIGRRNEDGPEPDRWTDTTNATVPEESTDAGDEMDEDLPAPPATPVRALSQFEIPPGVFRGPIPQSALNETPLPGYNQVASRGKAPLYSGRDPLDMPITKHTLLRLSEYIYFLKKALSDELRNELIDMYSAGYIAIEMPHRYSVARLQKIIDAAEYLEKGFVRLRNQAHDRRKIVFEHTTTSATYDQVADWIVEITRNPENSVRSHTRRFTEWIWLLRHEFDLATSPEELPDDHKFADGSSIPDYVAVKFAFEQEEACDQMAMQGEVWDESSSRYVERTRQQIHADKAVVAESRRRDREFPFIYHPDAWFHGGGDEDQPDFGLAPLHSDTRTPIRVPTAFGVPNPRPMPGPNDPIEGVELQTDQPREVIDLTGDSPDAMEID
ncbi:hypothetical protein KCU65_g366, partial [Aureobasidium melanogenum]